MVTLKLAHSFYKLINTGEIRTVQPFPLGLKPQNSVMIISKIKKGFPARSFEKLRNKLDVSEKALSKVLNIAVTTLARRKNAGWLSFEEFERLFRLVCLYEKAVEVFEDPQMARKWLKKPSWGIRRCYSLQYAVCGHRIGSAGS
jgi:putative toxin-antitoxin system antitoxin component (TIGR02293 family)